MIISDTHYSGKPLWMLCILYILATVILTSVTLECSPVQWLRHDAEVWVRYQTVSARLDTIVARNGSLEWSQGSIPVSLNVPDSTFTVTVPLKYGENWFVSRFDSLGTEMLSDTLRLNLRLSLVPTIEASASVQGREIMLLGKILENPDSIPITFSWTVDPKNPAGTTIISKTDTTASAILPEGAPTGEYYFNLTGVTSNLDTTRARTLVTVTPEEIRPFDIRKDHAAWIDTAIIYEITPYSFVIDGRFPDIRDKLPELKELGVNTLWIQPVCRTKWGEHGYDVINYFAVRSDYGTESELHDLIRSAHEMGMRVILDIVINHSSIYHRYAQHSINNGETSHYYDFYQREEDNGPYSTHYSRYRGFINYFWDELPNLNYDNPEVRNWMLSACKYWIEKFDIDGYRFDAIWGVTARCPDFTKELRLALKRIKPEILMLAEDKASQDYVFDERFDLAFEWAPGEFWVSQWYYETMYNDWWTNKQNTIFNTVSPLDRVDRLRKILFNAPAGYADNALILRYMGNNDLIPFTRNHTLEQTKMAATLFMSLHGVPMIYNGQEIGFDTHPYSAAYIFQRGKTIRSLDKTGLYDFYQYLIRMRKKYPAISSSYFREIPVLPENYAFAYHRKFQNENIVGIINMTQERRDITLSLSDAEINMDSSLTYFLSDLITGSVYSGTPGELVDMAITVPAHTTSLFVLADTLTPVHTLPHHKTGVPKTIALSQNHPNPFNPVTSFTFELPESGRAEIVVYDLMGREVRTLVKGSYPAGRHRIVFDSSGLTSGIYFYRLRFNDKILNRKMIVVK